MKLVSIRTILWMTYLFTAQALAAEDELPWAFKGTPAQGYSIDLVSVDPAPGTPLIAGASVEFTVTLKYSMSVSKTGTIILVFQDEKDRAAMPEAKQVSQAVSEPQGTAKLNATVTIPKGATELRLFVPLVPDGLSETSGEVTIRYPVKKK